MAKKPTPEPEPEQPRPCQRGHDGPIVSFHGIYRCRACGMGVPSMSIGRTSGAEIPFRTGDPT